jgi:putative tryptophan/tyrosine transport system substrate-binding protein
MLNLLKINHAVILQGIFFISSSQEKRLIIRSHLASLFFSKLINLYESYCYQLVITLVFLFALLNNPVLAHKTFNILIVASTNDQPFQQAVSGFKDQLSLTNKINYTELPLQQAEGKSTKDLEGMKFDLIYALGGEASKWASDTTKNTPIVTTLVLKEELFSNSTNMTGISLNYPLSTQFDWLKKFFPLQKTIAILYNPAENESTIQEARQLSQKAGFNLIAIPVEGPKNLPYALEQLANNIEILMAIPDETVMSLATAKEVLLASFRNKVPLVGLSDNWVKSGALYALSWDYIDLGKQCADMANKLLQGTPIKNIHPEHPRKVTYTINSKIAEHMNLEIPNDLLNNAKAVFNK